MFLQQLDVRHRHAAVHRLAHVVDGQQRDLDGGQGFHFDAGRADGLHRGAADDVGGVCGVGLHGLEFDGHPCECERVAQGDQVAGFLGGLDAGDAGDAEHIAFLGGARFNDGQRRGMHVDAATGDGGTVRAGLGRDIDHVGLALCVKMGQGVHCGDGMR
jgi:hypothetical protein